MARRKVSGADTTYLRVVDAKVHNGKSHIQFRLSGELADRVTALFAEANLIDGIKELIMLGLTVLDPADPREAAVIHAMRANVHAEYRVMVSGKLKVWLSELAAEAEIAHREAREAAAAQERGI